MNLPKHESASAKIPPPLKRGFPVVIIFVLVGILILIGAAVAVIKLLPGKTPPVISELLPGTITWWGLWESEEDVRPLIEEYQNTHKGVKINYIAQSKEDYRERLVNSLAKGEGPDVFRFHNSWVPMLKNSLDRLPASVMSLSDFAKTFYPIAVSDLTVNGTITGMPLEYDGLALFVNESIFARTGKNFPRSWDELRKTACELTTFVGTNLSQSGLSMGTVENTDHWQEIVALMILQNHADPGNPTSALATDAIGYYLAFADGRACKEYRNIRTWDTAQPSSTTAFANGKVAMYFGPSWRAFDIQAINPNLRFRTIRLPQITKASPTDSDITYASYWVEGVWAKSKNKTLAWDFLKYLTQKETLVKFSQNAARNRLFGEPYPRMDMAELLVTDSVVGSVILDAPYAKSWYLYALTWDGVTGINTQINKLYEDALKAIKTGRSQTESVGKIPEGVNQILGQYRR